MLSNQLLNEMKSIWKLAGVKNLYLTEGINEVKKYFPLISDNDFKVLIELDPTYTGGNELGIYGKWILNLYNNFIKDKIALEKWEEQQKQGKNYPQPEKKSQEQIEDFEKLPKLLSDFNNIKQKAKLNINNIKSIAQLYQVIENTKSQGISTNTKVQRGIELFKKSINKGGKAVFKDNKWVVLVPETFESSKVFGEDTNWCTTSSRGDYYNHYLEKYSGQYFINLNLETGDLYQFHFESDQFMDSSDNPIELSEILSNDNKLKQFYADYVQTQEFPNYILLLQLIENPSEEIQKLAVQQDGYAIKYIKNPSEEVQKTAVNQESYAIQYIKNPSEEIQKLAVQKNGYVIEYIKNPSEEIQKLAVQYNGYAIVYIKNPTKEVQKLAVQQNGAVIQTIKNPSYELQKLAVQKNSAAIQYIENPSYELQKLAVQQDEYNIKFIKNPSYELQKLAVQQNGAVIRYIENPSYELQKLAVQENGYAIEYIENPSEEIQKLAVQQDGYAIYYIENPSEEVQKLAVQQDGYAIKYIKNPSEEVQKLAVQENMLAIKFIKNPSEEAQKIAVKQNINIYKYINNPYPSVTKYYNEHINSSKDS